jgi:major membrane immunogen (membrane-anchored lipoprotein)
MAGKVVLVLIFLVILVSCGENSSSLKDGYYTAEAAEFDEHGWKEYVTICVSGGRIILIEYNAYNASGFIKSWDMRYMRLMNGDSGTYPNAYTRYYAGQLLNRQGTDGIECLAGATNSYLSFLKLSDAAMENAGKADDETRLIYIEARH